MALSSNVQRLPLVAGMLFVLVFGAACTTSSQAASSSNVPGASMVTTTVDAELSMEEFPSVGEVISRVKQRGGVIVAGEVLSSAETYGSVDDAGKPITSGPGYDAATQSELRVTDVIWGKQATAGQILSVRQLAAPRVQLADIPKLQPGEKAIVALYPFEFGYGPTGQYMVVGHYATWKNVGNGEFQRADKVRSVQKSVTIPTN